MKQEKQQQPPGNLIALLLIICNAVIIESAFLNKQNMYLWLFLTVPLLVLAILDPNKQQEA